MTTQKSWGTSTLIYHDTNTEVHRACINKGGICSKHYHDFKYNFFFVETGLLIVKIWESNDSYKEVFLHAGDKITVEPKKWHKFLAIEQSNILEIYYTRTILDDIIRQ